MSDGTRHSVGGLKGSRTFQHVVFKLDLRHRTVHKVGDDIAHGLLAALIEGGEQISLQKSGDSRGRTSIRMGLEEMLDDVCKMYVATFVFNPASTNRTQGISPLLDACAAKAVQARHQGCRLVHDFVADRAFHALRHFRECVFEDIQSLLLLLEAIFESLLLLDAVFESLLVFEDSKSLLMFHGESLLILLDSELLLELEDSDFGRLMLS